MHTAGYDLKKAMFPICILVGILSYTHVCADQRKENPRNETKNDTKKAPENPKQSDRGTQGKNKKSDTNTNSGGTQGKNERGESGMYGQDRGGL